MAHLMNVNLKADTDAGRNMVIHELKEDKRKLKAYGSFSEYADPVKIASEKEAWPAAAVEKHDNS